MLAVWITVALPIAVRFEVQGHVPRSATVGATVAVLLAVAAASRWPSWWLAIGACALVPLFALFPAWEAAAVGLFAVGLAMVWQYTDAAQRLVRHDLASLLGIGLPVASAATSAAIGLPWIIVLLFTGASAAYAASTCHPRVPSHGSSTYAVAFPSRELLDHTAHATSGEQPGDDLLAVDTELPRWVPRWIGAGHRLPLLAWLVVAVPMNLLQEIVNDVTQEGLGAAQAVLPPYSVFGGRVAWDSTNFVTIATDGYGSGQALEASFPGYPMLIRGLMWITNLDVYTSAVLVSATGGLAATVLFWRWTEVVGLGARPRLAALGLFLAFPASFVLFGVAYADSVMMALIIGSLLAVSERRDILAAVLGAAATFTRPNALALVPALIVLVLHRDAVLTLRQRSGGPVDEAADGFSMGPLRIVPSRLRASQAWVLASLGGIGCYALWMWRHAGDPLFFWSIQTDHYGHRPISALSTWLKIEFLDRPGEFVHNGPDALNQLAATVVAGGSLLATPAVARRLGPGYAVLVISSVTILWATAMWFAPARYLLPALPPLAAVGAGYLAKRPVALGLVLGAGLVVSLLLGGAFAAVFRLNW